MYYFCIMIKIYTLSDNYNNEFCLGFTTEHGYSLYIEFDGKKILIDTGASDNFLKNAEKMGIDISKIDMETLLPSGI